MLNNPYIYHLCSIWNHTLESLNPWQMYYSTNAEYFSSLLQMADFAAMSTVFSWTHLSNILSALWLPSLPPTNTWMVGVTAVLLGEELPEVTERKKKQSKLAKLVWISVCEEDDVALESTMAKASKQITAYKNLIQQKTLVLSSDDSPIIWWKQLHSMIPGLGLLARSYLCAQATSCFSERLFSKAGFMVKENRTTLTPQNVNMLVFIATNTK